MPIARYEKYLSYNLYFMGSGLIVFMYISGTI